MATRRLYELWHNKCEMTFGQYEGVPIEDIPREYLDGLYAKLSKYKLVKYSPVEEFITYYRNVYSKQ